MKRAIFRVLAILFVLSSVAELHAANIKGKVTCDGRGVAGVVVTDGFSVVTTNKKGLYKMRTDDAHARFVYISTPSGYEVPSVRGFMPDFFRPLKAEQKEYNFTLKAVDQSKYHLVVSADVHVRNRAMTKKAPTQQMPLSNPVGELDSVTFVRTYMATLRDYVAQLPSDATVYGLNLGDMSNESHWRGKYNGDLESFVSVCERSGMPIQTYTVIGNHEHDMKAVDIFDDDDTAAEEEYLKLFGPTYYSFNIGSVHYVVLDNVKYCNHKSKGKDRNYEVRITQEQIDWAARDAALMPKDTKQVVFAWHCPSYRQRTNGEKSTHNADAVIGLYAERKLPMTILSGHNHQAETIVVKGFENTVEYIHPSVSGSWWYFPLCSDGAPSTFTRYDFEGGLLASRESVNFANQAEQKYRLYNKGQRNQSGEAVVRLNVWDWHPKWRFEVYEDGQRVERPNLRTIKQKDPLYDQMREITGNGIKKLSFLNTAVTYHFVEYAPQNANAEIRIVAFDEFGKEYFTLTTRAE